MEHLTDHFEIERKKDQEWLKLFLRLGTWKTMGESREPAQLFAPPIIIRHRVLEVMNTS